MYVFMNLKYMYVCTWTCYADILLQSVASSLHPTSYRVEAKLDKTRRETGLDRYSFEELSGKHDSESLSSGSGNDLTIASTIEKQTDKMVISTKKIKKKVKRCTELYCIVSIARSADINVLNLPHVCRMSYLQVQTKVNYLPAWIKVIVAEPLSLSEDPRQRYSICRY